MECTEKERATCQEEKRSCKGCYYNSKNNKRRNYYGDKSVFTQNEEEEF